VLEDWLLRGSVLALAIHCWIQQRRSNRILFVVRNLVDVVDMLARRGK